MDVGRCRWEHHHAGFRLAIANHHRAGGYPFRVSHAAGKRPSPGDAITAVDDLRPAQRHRGDRAFGDIAAAEYDLDVIDVLERIVSEKRQLAAV